MRNSGNLKDRIDFISRGNGKDEWGSNTLDPEIVLSCWVQVQTQGTKEFSNTKGTSMENSVTFIIRNQLESKINSSMRIKYKSKIYEIVRINPDVKDDQWCYIQAVNK